MYFLNLGVKGLNKSIEREDDCMAVVLLCSNRWLKIGVTARQKSVLPVSAFHRGFQEYSHVLPEDCEVQTSRAERTQIRTKAAKACKTIQNR